MTTTAGRVCRLYRPVYGWSWWFQIGVWARTEGPVGIATGRVRRRFIVSHEWPYRTRQEAESRLREYAGRQETEKVDAGARTLREGRRFRKKPRPVREPK